MGGWDLELPGFQQSHVRAWLTGARFLAPHVHCVPRLISWPPWAFYLVGITAFAQLIVRGVLLGLTVDQWTVWNDMDEVAGLAPASSSVLRLVAALLGLPLAVCGLYFFVFPPHKHPRRLTYLGYAGAVIMVLFLASGIVDGAWGVCPAVSTRRRSSVPRLTPACVLCVTRRHLALHHAVGLSRGV